MGHVDEIQQPHYLVSGRGWGTVIYTSSSSMMMMVLMVMMVIEVMTVIR